MSDPTRATRTVAAALEERLRHDPGAPLVTAYDDTTGERTELSVTTYANWVAKTASLLVEEVDLERGDDLLVDLPVHWLGPVVLGAAWTVGARVVVPGDDADFGDARPAAVVCGPAGLERWAHLVGEVPVVASALLPLGRRFVEPLPSGVLDLGAEVWSQPDAFVAWDPAVADDPALLAEDGAWTQAEVLADASADRLLTVRSATTGAGARTFAALLAGGGSLVLTVPAPADPDALARRSATERATRTEA